MVASLLPDYEHVSIVRILKLLLPIAAGIAVIVFAVSNREAPRRVDVDEVRSAVRVVTVKPGRFMPRINGFGSVAPARVWNAVAQVPGRVAFINPQFVRGGTVGKGDVLVRIADDDYKLAVAQAEASIESATAEIEQKQLTGVTISRSLALEREALGLAQRELDRQRKLAEQGTVAASRVETQESAFLAQRAKVQDLENQLELIPAQIKLLEQSLAVAQANLEIARLNLAHTVVAAPFDARVADSAIEISQFVGAGSVMGILDGISAAEIDVQIPPRQMAGFMRLSYAGRPPPGGDAGPQLARASGLSAVVHLGFPEGDPSWQAEVTRISDTVDPQTRSIGVIVSVSDPYARVSPGERPPLIKGMFASVELRGPVVDDVVLLPRAAVRAGKVLIAGDDDRLTMQAVDIIYTYADFVVLAAGSDGALAPGTRVIVSDASPAVEGMLLSVVTDARTAARLRDVAMPDGAGE